MNSGGSIEISLRPSSRITMALAAFHLSSIALVCVLDLPVWMAIAATIAIVGNGAWSVRRLGRLLGAASVTGVSVAPDRECTLHCRDGTSCRGHVDDATVVTAYLVVLVVATGQRAGYRRAVIAPDMLSPDEFRRLRVVLRWGQPAQAPGAIQA